MLGKSETKKKKKKGEEGKNKSIKTSIFPMPSLVVVKQFFFFLG